jgi:hypothetical protein
MGKQDIDKRKLMVTGAHASTEIPHVRVESDRDDVFIIVTQAYGPAGDSLVGLSEVTFDGFPAVTLKVRVNGQEGLVHLSPFHGDPRKEGFVEIPDGAICELMCPVSGLRLDDLGEVSPGSEARYCAIYLTPALSRGEVVAVSNVWGDYRSRIVDGAELISSWGVAS